MDELRREPPWTMLFADDIVICKETRKEVEQRIKCWRYALERRGMKLSRSKTECLCINKGNDKETVKMDDTKVPRVTKFEYLGSMVQESGSCEREVKKESAGRMEQINLSRCSRRTYFLLTTFSQKLTLYLPKTNSHSNRFFFELDTTIDNEERNKL